MRENRRKASSGQRQNNMKKSKLSMRKYGQRLKAKQDRDTADAKVPKRKTRQKQKSKLQKRTYWGEKQQSTETTCRHRKKRLVREKVREGKRQKRHTEHVHVTHRKQENTRNKDEIVSAVFQSLRGHKTKDKLTRNVVTIKLNWQIMFCVSVAQPQKLVSRQNTPWLLCKMFSSARLHKNIDKRKNKTLRHHANLFTHQFKVLRDDVSTQLPNKHDVSQKTMLAKRVLN